jgi:hypothetical protein
MPRAFVGNECNLSSLHSEQPTSCSAFRTSLKLASLAVACFLLPALLTACAAERTYRDLPPGEGPAIPRVVELGNELSIETVHFPRGAYFLSGEDEAGYYYRAPKQLIKHAFAGFQQYDGGIFMPKRNPQNVRGYIVWAGGRTKIGHLSPRDYAFRG